jgi:hypothetical protein
MYSQAVVAETRKASRRQVHVDVPRFPANIGGASTSYALSDPDPLPSNALNHAEHDRQASLEFLHLLVMGAGGD